MMLLTRQIIGHLNRLARREFMRTTGGCKRAINHSHPLYLHSTIAGFIYTIKREL
jgi:hypothetical protein